LDQRGDAADDQEAAVSVQVKDGFAYWANENVGPTRAPVGGGAAVTLAADVGAYWVAVDGEDVYWTNGLDETVKRAPRAGGLPVVLAHDQALPEKVVVDDRYVYWIDSAVDGAVMKLAK
jgi:hypothetical protein